MTFITATGYQIDYVDTRWARVHILPNLQRAVARGLLTPAETGGTRP